MTVVPLRTARTLTLSVVLVTCLLPGCSFDRKRPNPVEPDAHASLSVEVVEPRDGITVIAGRDMTVRVSARDLSGTLLEGVGYVVRRFGSGNNATLDSVVIAFDETAEATREFAFAVPASLPTSTQLDITGMAFGPGSQFRLSIPRSVIVARCQPGQLGC
jgi:hypothetical protein